MKGVTDSLSLLTSPELLACVIMFHNLLWQIRPDHLKLIDYDECNLYDTSWYIHSTGCDGWITAHGLNLQMLTNQICLAPSSPEGSSNKQHLPFQKTHLPSRLNQDRLGDQVEDLGQPWTARRDRTFTYPCPTWPDWCAAPTSTRSSTWPSPGPTLPCLRTCSSSSSLASPSTC